MKFNRKELSMPADPETYIELVRGIRINGEYHRVGFEHYEVEEIHDLEPTEVKVTNWNWRDDNHSKKADKTHRRSDHIFGQGFEDMMGRLISENIYYED